MLPFVVTRVAASACLVKYNVAVMMVRIVRVKTSLLQVLRICSMLSSLVVINLVFVNDESELTLSLGRCRKKLVLGSTSVLARRSSIPKRRFQQC